MTMSICLLLIFKLFLICCIESSIVINTTSGDVIGKSVEVQPNRFVRQFLNIPYAEPPLGRLRFAKPVPIITPRNGIIDGTKPGNSCFQSFNPYPITTPQNEDCLVLNVWSNCNPCHLKPVMFYIHGGGFTAETIFQNSPTHTYGDLLALHGVVVVTSNYRLGNFGWLYGGNESAPGNVGLFDNLLALSWVRENIRQFGGDPSQITIFGQDYGAEAISALIISPLAKGLFTRAILQSGSSLQNKNAPIIAKEKALEQAMNMATYFNCSHDNEWLDCLRKVDAHLINNYYGVTPYTIFGTNIVPFSPLEAFQTKKYNEGIDIIIGNVQDVGGLLAHWVFPSSESMISISEFSDLVESTQNSIIFPIPNLDPDNITKFYLKGFSTPNTEDLKLAFYKFFGDITITCRTYLFAKLFAKYSTKSKVYFYEWTYASSVITSELQCTEDMGVCLQADIPYVWGEPVRRNLSDKEFSEYVMKLWTNFAKFGNPLVGFPSGGSWPRLIEADNGMGLPQIKEINPLKPNHIINDLYADTCDDFWKDYFL